MQERHVYTELSYGEFTLGVIAKCEKGEERGYLFTNRKFHYSNKVRYESKIYIFDKSLDFFVAPQTIVLFNPNIKNSDTNCKINGILLLSSFTFLSDRRGTLRENGIYHDDTTWDLIVKGKPYIDINTVYSVHTHSIRKNTRNKFFHTCLSSILYDEEMEVIDLLTENKRLGNELSKYSEYEYECYLNNISKYVEEFDINKIVNSYKVYRVEKWIQRVGRDYDHYSITRIYISTSKDKYIATLLPVKVENVKYIFNFLPYSDEDNRGTYFEKEITQEIRENALSQYSKNAHIDFLKNVFIMERDSIVDKLTKNKKRIKQIFKFDNLIKIFEDGEKNIEEKIKLYNISTIVKDPPKTKNDSPTQTFNYASGIPFAIEMNDIDHDEEYDDDDFYNDNIFDNYFKEKKELEQELEEVIKEKAYNLKEQIKEILHEIFEIDCDFYGNEANKDNYEYWLLCNYTDITEKFLK